jgi:hypothetical protein
MFRIKQDKKSNKNWAKTITRKTKRKAQKRSTDAQPTRMKEGRELVPLIVESYFTHNFSNVTYMQIMSLKIIGGLEQASPVKKNLLLYGRG